MKHYDWMLYDMWQVLTNQRTLFKSALVTLFWNQAILDAYNWHQLWLKFPSKTFTKTSKGFAWLLQIPDKQITYLDDDDIITALTSK